MTIIVPVAIPPAPEPPDRAQRSTFNVRAVAWAEYQKDELVPGVNDANDAAYSNALHSQEMAEDAAEFAASASDASSVAAAAANFKGMWADLTGPLNKPATVKHNGRFWLLLNNLADVTTEEPTPSNADWTALDAGIRPSQTLTSTGVHNAVVGVMYNLDADGIILVASTVWVKGDYYGFRLMDGRVGCIARFGATPFRKVAAGDMELDIPRLALDTFYEDTTRGLV